MPAPLDPSKLWLFDDQGLGRKETGRVRRLPLAELRVAPFLSESFSTPPGNNPSSQTVTMIYNSRERFTPLCFCNSHLLLALLWSLSDLQAELLLRYPGRVVTSKFGSDSFWFYDGLLLSGCGRIPEFHESRCCDAWCLRRSRSVDASGRAAPWPGRPIFVDACSRLQLTLCFITGLSALLQNASHLSSRIVPAFSELRSNLTL